MRPAPSPTPYDPANLPLLRRTEILRRYLMERPTSALSMAGFTGKRSNTKAPYKKKAGRVLSMAHLGKFVSLGDLGNSVQLETVMKSE